MAFFRFAAVSSGRAEAFDKYLVWLSAGAGDHGDSIPAPRPREASVRQTTVESFVPPAA